MKLRYETGTHGNLIVDDDSGAIVAAFPSSSPIYNEDGSWNSRAVTAVIDVLTKDGVQ